MLRRLSIKNFAVVRELELVFGPGLNLLTGETGAGKSIIVDALALVVGGRAAPDVVRAGASVAVVEAEFQLAAEAGAAVAELLAADGVASEQGGLLLRREVQAVGRSRALVNDQSVTAALLRRLQPFLVEIHGQGEQQALASARAHVEFLDAVAGCERERHELAALHARRAAVCAALDAAEATARESARALEFIEFQLREIERIAPQPGEDEELEAELKLLAEAETVQALAAEAYAELYESDRSALALIAAAERRIERLAEFDDALAELVERLAQAAALVADVAEEVRTRLARVDFSPERLAAVEARLAELDRLKRRYGGSLQDVEELARELRRQRDAYAGAADRVAELRAERSALEAEYARRAAALSARRQRARRTLEQRVARELAALAMERARFVVEMRTAVPADPAFYSATGADQVEFLLAANPGEPPRALGRVASGGELSRVMLALLTACRAQSGAATLVFDEIDAGIGGGVAEAVGRRLRALAQGGRQVICVTHQAPVARFAEHHFLVTKRVEGERAEVAVRKLAWDERVAELARLIGAEDVVAGRAAAQWMLEEAQGG